MKLHLDLILPAVLVAMAGSELVTPDAISPERADRTCQADHDPEGTTRLEAEQRILADGYSEIATLAKDCRGAWHALAFAEGDPVNVIVTPDGMVLTE